MILYENVRKCMKLYENTFLNTLFALIPKENHRSPGLKNSKKSNKRKLCGHLFDPEPYRKKHRFTEPTNKQKVEKTQVVWSPF